MAAQMRSESSLSAFAANNEFQHVRTITSKPQLCSHVYYSQTSYYSIQINHILSYHLQSSDTEPPFWAIADDVFWNRYAPYLSNVTFPWQTIASVSLLPAYKGLTPPPPPRLAEVINLGDRQDQSKLPPNWGPWSTLEPTPHHDKPGFAATRQRLLFQYKPYCEQDHLNLTDVEISAVLEAVFGNIDLAAAPSALAARRNEDHQGGQAGGVGSATSNDAAGIILIKMIMDMYLKAGPKFAFPLALTMLEVGTSY